MSASHRSLRRLPNTIFTNLTSNEDDHIDNSTTRRTALSSSSSSLLNNPSPSELLQEEICKKLKELGSGSSSSSNNNSNNSNNSNNINSNSNSNNHDNGSSNSSSRKQETRGGGIASITTVGQIMRLSPPTLLRALDPLLTNEECQELIQRISDYCTPTPKTAKELLSEIHNDNQQNYPPLHPHNQSYLSTDVPQLDNILRGGIRYKTITEIVGRAGVGKTQLVMQLATVAAAYDIGSIYIDTERKLSLSRLNEIATERYEEYTSRMNQTNSIHNDNNNDDNYTLCSGKENEGKDEMSVKYKEPIDVLNNISVHTPDSTADLLSVISTLQEEIVLRCSTGNMDDSSMMYEYSPNNETKKDNNVYPVKLIILDSIAAPARRDFGGEDAKERVTAIFQIAQMLKQIADEMNVAVVVINQIEKVMSLNNNKRGGASSSSNNHHDNHNDGDGKNINSKASLGTSWHHCVSTRILLDHDVDPHQDDSYGLHYLDNMCSSTGRKATVVKSNIVGSASMNFEVTKMGICQL